MESTHLYVALMYVLARILPRSVTKILEQSIIWVDFQFASLISIFLGFFFFNIYFFFHFAFLQKDNFLQENFSNLETKME